MPFLFSYVCDLLQRLEDNRLARSGLRSNAAIIQEWFRGHQAHFYRGDHNSAALLSALLPEKRTDRVYQIREKKLQIVIGRALGLGRSRIAQLARWTIPEACADLADCVESILKETPNPISPTHRAVTVEEVDQLLHSIASTCRFSSPLVRSSASENRLADQELALGALFTRLSARDAKWLTRLVLKNYEPVVLDQHLVCASYHPLLPTILKVQDDLAIAGRILDSQKLDRTVTGRNDLTDYLKPTLGVKIGRQTWVKGRSIKHCLSMARGRISCEEKMDGEYCQIHIDLSKGHDCIQIFSKSGKDSTMDRMALHEHVPHPSWADECVLTNGSSIRKSLQLDQPSCPLTHGCILEGELVVYSDKDSKILDFHTIRKHVSRSGSFLGTGQDSQPHPWEHLMIVYYDVLMVDNRSLLAVKHSERSQTLQQLITVVPGQSALVKRQTIDCSRPSATSDLRRAFAKCITARGEGLVLKADDPYVDFGTVRGPYRCCVIKLKKEYIGHFGDVGDFAVVGARFDAAKARTYSIPRLKWTHFYVGCLENKEEVQRFGKPPQFVVTNVVELNATQLGAFVSSVNPPSVRPEDNTAISLRIEPGIDNGKRPSVIFPTPPVVDLRCFSFDKNGNTGFWSPRFPYVTKLHCDRTYHDAVSFAELQDMAMKDKEMPPPEDSQELLGWIAALEGTEPATTLDAVSQSTTPSVQSSQPERLPLSPITPRAKGTDSTNGPRAAPVGGRLTPPRSSVAQMPGPKAPAAVGEQEAATRGRKRLRESLAEDPPQETGKIRKCSTDQVDDSTASLPNDDPRPSTTQREAIASAPVLSRRNTDTGLPVSKLQNPSPMHLSDSKNEDAGTPGTARPPFSTSMSFHGGVTTRSTAPASAPSVNSRQPNLGDTGIQAALGQPTDATGGKCSFLPGSCKLSTFAILLAPCISNFPWVTEDLLSCHGVTDFVRDPREWLDHSPTTAPSSSSTSSGAAHPNPAATRSRRRIKIALIDARRREASEAFLQSIQDAGLTRRNGDREYVAVYDWRVLEELRDGERKCGVDGQRPGGRFDVSGSRSMWRRFWVGLA